MQQAGLVAAGLPWTYDAYHVSAGALPGWLNTTGRDLRGFNATIPHKISLMAYMDELDPAAGSIGAVNTVVHVANGLRGYNTDPAGFLLALAAMRFDARGAAVVVFGAGGAARAVLYALRPHTSRITIASRDVRRARAIARDEGAVALGDPVVSADVRDADLLVNATPMGMSHLPDASPLPMGTELRSETAVMDLVYGRDTPLLMTARQTGCRCADGREMLVQQGAEAFRLWTGREPNVDVMREALITCSGASPTKNIGSGR
jgi:shikimate dehydrogenase